MYKRVLIILLSLFLLMGCGKQDDMNNVLQIREELEVKDSIIQKQQEKIDELSNRLEDLENSLMSIKSQSYYYDYLTEFISDVVRELDDYSTIKGMIIDYDPEKNLVELDVLEYVAYYDEDRIKELNIDTENELIISGSYIYNAADDNRIFKTNENLKFYFHSNDDPGIMVYGTLDDLSSTIQEKPELSYTLHLVNGVVVRITDNFYN